MADTIKCPGSGCGRDIVVGDPNWGEVQCECGQVVVNRPGSVVHGRAVVNKSLAEGVGRLGHARPAGGIVQGSGGVEKNLGEVLGRPAPPGGSRPKLPQGGSSTAPPKAPTPPLPLEVTGKCPTCGAPVYGRKEIAADDKYPKVVYSCLCRNNDLVRTK